MVKDGDIVTRQSHGNDMYFYVIGLDEKKNVKLSGLYHRLSADAPIDDLIVVKRVSLMGVKRIFRDDVEDRVREILRNRRQRDFMPKRAIPAKVLHIDADLGYLTICMTYYRKLGVPAFGVNVLENSQPYAIKELLQTYTPDILILTGHDSMKSDGVSDKDDEYASSKFYGDAVEKARQVQSSKDALVIIAGACQSNYEYIMECGANFASSPGRVMIHALDPVFAAEKIAFSLMDETIEAGALKNRIMTADGAFGGIETRGMLRLEQKI